MEQEVSSYEEMTEATNQILCHALPEAFLPLAPAEVQGVDVTPALHGEGQLPTLPSGFSSPGERSVNSRSPSKPPLAPYIWCEWGALSLCCSCNTSCRKDVEVN